MVKVSSADIVAVLRRFDVADDETVPRFIEQIRISHPSATNTLVSFRFRRTAFYLLFDDTLEDDTSRALDYLKTDKQSITGEFIKNPNDHLTTYALPFKGKDVYLFEVASTKLRLDVLLAERHPDTSRSTWQKHVKAGHVSVNDIVVTSPKHDVLETDAISLAIPDATDFSEDTLPIIYMDDNVIVVNKPTGVLTHAKGALNDEFTVAEFFRRYTTFGLDGNRPGIVHRLDRDTSGVIIGARNPETATLLQKQFADRKTKKTYIAVVDGTPKEPRAKVDLPIGRNPSVPSTFRVDPKGKDAVTDYEVVKSNGKQTMITLRPRTGRTHQLRVHMQYLKTPIHGDRVYGKASDRLYLHAKELEITIPISERRTFSAPTPSEFEQFFGE